MDEYAGKNNIRFSGVSGSLIAPIVAEILNRPRIKCGDEGLFADEGLFSGEGLCGDENPCVDENIANCPSTHLMRGPSVQSTLIITTSAESARDISTSLTFFTDRPIFTLPDEDPYFFEFEAKSRDEMFERLACVSALMSGENAIVIAPVSAALKKMLPPEDYAAATITLSLDGEGDIELISRKLSDIGYERTALAEKPGEYSVRGGILDVFSIDAKFPVRAEFFGDDIDTLRYYNPLTQKSVQEIETCTIFPASEIPINEERRKKAAIAITEAYDDAIEGQCQGHGSWDKPRMTDGVGNDGGNDGGSGIRTSGGVGGGSGLVTPVILGLSQNPNDDNRLRNLHRRRDELSEMFTEGANRQYLEHYINLITDNQATLTDFLPNDGIVFIDDPDRCREFQHLSQQDAWADFEILLSKGEVIPADFDSMQNDEDFERLGQGHPKVVFTPFDNEQKNWIAGQARNDTSTLLRPASSHDAPASLQPASSHDVPASLQPVSSHDALASLQPASTHDTFASLHDTLVSLRPPSRNLETHRVSINAKRPPHMNGDLKLLLSELKRLIKAKYEIVIVCSTDVREENIRHFLSDEDLLDKVSVVRGELSSGIELPDSKKVWLWADDIFRTGRKRRRRRTDSDSVSIRSFTEITAGDYVVHEYHGIAQYLGIEQKHVNGVRRDYLKLSYSGGDFLYVPVDQMSVVQKYIGSGENIPKVNSLTGNEWKNAKSRARADIAAMAGELVALQAERKAKSGYAFAEDTVWQKEFEDKFPYEETSDQLRCVESIKADMQQPICMDRLLCGDVGYGKTEVALRAIFKCVSEGKQAAVLVPTTILAAQHFETFTQRFEDFPFKVEMLSRFRSQTEQKEILNSLSRGTVDVVIGTHRLLSTDVKFKDLGLLVIDEEQRFGVKHKEKMKKLKTNVDVLTLTATPIPRTLHMSLMGLRDMDVIAESPEDRYPVQTYVMEESEQIIKETIQRELGRGGQVYVVSPRISGIDRIAELITDLVPEAGVVVGHGQMNERELEDIMLGFTHGEYDVLVSTTIIESGIDIPNVNTILIVDADRFGLSQLYQLRGRVGRTNRIAYAYLLYRKGKMLSEVADERLKTIREFTELGSGFKIAMRDLEIRGAGDILGAQQHGHIVQVGYELYAKLVNEAVAALSVQKLPEEDPEIVIDIGVAAFIPEYYITDEALKLQLYKKISSVQSSADIKEVLSEATDMFGMPPRSVRDLAKVALIRHLAAQAGVRRIFTDEQKAVLHFVSPDKFSPQGSARAFKALGSRISISGAKTPAVRMSYSGNDELLDGLIETLSCLKVENVATLCQVDDEC